MSSAKPTNGTLFGSRHDVSAAALKKASTKAQQQQSRRRLQPIDAVSAAGKEFRAWDDAKNSKKRTDLKKIMIIGAGPIVIGQVITLSLLSVSHKKGEERNVGAEKYFGFFDSSLVF